MLSLRQVSVSNTAVLLSIIDFFYILVFHFFRYAGMMVGAVEIRFVCQGEIALK